tara:strand:- start:880 stop:2685 length:1806 start_codon:yes stop_codon:yes gene_type:complete
MHEDFHSLYNEIDILLAPFGARRISSRELSKLAQRYLAGWRIYTDLVFEKQDVIIDVLFKEMPINKPPTVAVCQPTIEPGSLPHIESNGNLCIWPEQYIADLNNLNFLVALVSDAFDLLRQAISGGINSHFEDEFQNYWLYHCNLNSNPISLCNLENTATRSISTYQANNKPALFADREQELISWLDNRRTLPEQSQKRKRSRHLLRIGRSALISLNNVWHPNQYPKTAGQLFKLIEDAFGNDSKPYELIGQALACEFIFTPKILLLFQSNKGPSLVSLEFERNIFKSDISYQRRGKTIVDGFRKSIPLSYLTMRASQLRTFGNLVHRADKSWVIGRDSNTAQGKLSSCKVAVIGCGSVGAAITRLLVQSGVDNLTLFDSDLIGTENSTRHILGFDSVGKNKASELARKLSSEFPHIEVDYVTDNWQNSKESISKIEQSDLILSCTANWYSDQELIKLQSDKTLGPIIFAFVEAHAIAGHVIINTLNSNAFNDLHNCAGSLTGTMKIPATKWNDNTLVKLPACAGAFQPYGVIPLSHLQAIAANAVISLLLSAHESDIVPKLFTWLGSTSDLTLLNGEWNAEWCLKYGDPLDGNKQFSTTL